MSWKCDSQNPHSVRMSNLVTFQKLVWVTSVSTAPKLLVRFNLHRPVIQEILSILKRKFVVHYEPKIRSITHSLNLSQRLLNNNGFFPSFFPFNPSYLKMLHGWKRFWIRMCMFFFFSLRLMWLIAQRKRRPGGADKLETVPHFLIIKAAQSKLR